MERRGCSMVPSGLMSLRAAMVLIIAAFQAVRRLGAELQLTTSGTQPRILERKTFCRGFGVINAEELPAGLASSFLIQYSRTYRFKGRRISQSNSEILTER